MGQQSLNTRDWSVAAATIHEGKQRVRSAQAVCRSIISEALQKYFDDAERTLAPSTIRKRRELLSRKLSRTANPRA